jgi:serine/threonine-protein phosphatase 2A regulatory subunit A
VLLALAEELAEFVPLVGGPQYAHFLLPPLEALAAVDETVVRDRAVESIAGVTGQMAAAGVQEHLLPLLQRLAGREWPARVSASKLFATAYPPAQEQQRTELRAAFLKLCHDETPMVRRAAAQALAPFSEALEAQHIRETLLPSFVDLTRDDQDSVRLIAGEIGRCCVLGGGEGG